MNGGINLVNDAVIAIATFNIVTGAKIMKYVIVDPFLLEVARAVDQDLSKKIGFLEALDKKVRLVAALRALREAGFAQLTPGRKVIAMKPAKSAICAMQLQEFRLSPAARRTALTPEFSFGLELRDSGFSDAGDLSVRYFDKLDKVLISESWRKIGTMVGDMAMGEIRLVGPEANYGLIFEALTQSARTDFGEGDLWFSLGERPGKNPDPIDLQHDVQGAANLNEIIIQWPIERQLGHRRIRSGELAEIRLVNDGCGDAASPHIKIKKS
jgi:hypothetical protein